MMKTKDERPERERRASSKSKPGLNEQIISDMMRHLTRKLHQIISDIADTCDTGGISDDYSCKLVMSCLMLELIKGAAYLELNETQFIHMCRVAYREIYQNVRENVGNG